MKKYFNNTETINNNVIKIFGYGSLIEIESLKKTVPETTNIFPATVHGYARLFETSSKWRRSKTGSPISVLNVKKDRKSFVNGICFDVTKNYIDNLLKREKAYKLVEITAQSFVNQKDKYTAFIFIDNSEIKQKFLFNDETQINYLKICLDGAKNFGKEFYATFIETTFIDQKSIKDIKELKHLLI